jgi:hypothetical protein
MLITAEDSAVPGWAGRPEWRVVPAVRDHRFIRIHGSEFHQPSLRAPAAVARLRSLLPVAP